MTSDLRQQYSDIIKNHAWVSYVYVMTDVEAQAYFSPVDENTLYLRLPPSRRAPTATMAAVQFDQSGEASGVFRSQDGVRRIRITHLGCQGGDEDIAYYAEVILNAMEKMASNEHRGESSPHVYAFLGTLLSVISEPSAEAWADVASRSDDSIPVLDVDGEEIPTINFEEYKSLVRQNKQLVEAAAAFEHEYIGKAGDGPDKNDVNEMYLRFGILEQASIACAKSCTDNLLSQLDTVKLGYALAAMVFLDADEGDRHLREALVDRQRHLGERRTGIIGGSNHEQIDRSCNAMIDIMHRFNALISNPNYQFHLDKDADRIRTIASEMMRDVMQDMESPPPTETPTAVKTSENVSELVVMG